MVNEVHSVGWLAKTKERIGLIAIGHTVKKIEEYLIDWLLYGTVVAYSAVTWGPYIGSVATLAVMLPITALLCLSYIRFYDWAKKDWLGFEILKEIRENEKKDSWFSRIAYRIARLGNIPAFIILSIYGDAFMTTVYLRKSANNYSGLSKRDMRIFWGSLVLSNAYWTLRWTLIVEVALIAWGYWVIFTDHLNPGDL